MKIVIFADIHGSLKAMEAVLQAAQREKPQKTVFCGDLFGGWRNNSQIAEMAQSLDGTLYFVKGNNDIWGDERLINGGMDDNVPMYHFGRTLFFTHGDRYNGWRVPPILRPNDALIFGHTHVGSLTKRNGLFVLNVGSVAVPRDGKPCYLVLEESGATLRQLNGQDIYTLPWD